MWKKLKEAFLVAGITREEFETLQREVKHLHDDLEDLEDKARRWFHRLSARQRVDDHELSPTPSEGDAAPPVDPVSAMILRRRARDGRASQVPKLPTD